METLLLFIGLYLVGALFVLPIWAIVKIRRHGQMLDLLDGQIRQSNWEVGALRDQLQKMTTPPETPAAGTTDIPASSAPTPTPAQPVMIKPDPVISTPVPPPVALEPEPMVTPEPPPLSPSPWTDNWADPADSVEPPPAPPPLPDPPVYVPRPPAKPAIQWEQFMGAKLFAWLGGFALFLGVAFFVKYSFEHNLIPPEVRVALGFLMALGLIVGGLKISRKKYAVTAQTFVAAGVVSLYAVTYACNSIYRFEFFTVLPTFMLMVLITTTAFLIAVRLQAPVVAILGMLGGFLTPVLLSTGVDNPPGLFGYLALLDAGLIAVTLRTGWRYLVPLSAGATVFMMIVWATRFFEAAKGPVAMIVCLGFSAIYLVAAALAKRREDESTAFTWSAVALPLVGFCFAFLFLDYPSLATQAPLYLGFVLLLDAALLRLTWNHVSLPRIHLMGGTICFGLLALWTARHLDNQLLPWALAAYLIFAALHTAFPLLLERRQPESTPTWWSQIFPPATLLLMLVPLLKIPETSILLWPAILLVDVLAIVLAVISASLTAIAAVLVLTLLAAGLCIFKLPVNGVLDTSLLLVIGGFAVFFFVAGTWLVRKLGDRLPRSQPSGVKLFGDARSQIPAFASLLPFILLIMASTRLAVPDPSMIFGLGLLLVVLTLGLTRIMTPSPDSTGPDANENRQAGIEWLPACALAGIAALEFVWHSRHFDPASASGPLTWYLGFYLLFAVYPFLFRSTFAKLTGPWAIAALSGLAHFLMTYSAIKLAWPNEFLGLIPAAFAIAPLVSLVAVLKTAPAESAARLNQLAWFGAAALCFITLIFPIQFDRQWLTVAWALEGAALLWLFQRVPHPGLRAAGVVLLCTAFARLALNSAVFSYHARSEIPIFNWYLYAYGLTIVALFAGARLLNDSGSSTAENEPRGRVMGINAPPLLSALGVVLTFLLLNIEIADYFTEVGRKVLTFKFSGNFARDMTYTIAWALFALGLLGAGIWRQARAARYAAIALLSVTLLKLFFHDLARLEALYRIGALFAVAVIAILASLAYQRFLPANEDPPPPPV